MQLGQIFKYKHKQNAHNMHKYINIQSVVFIGYG